MIRVGLLAPGRRYEDAFTRDAAALFDASGSNLGNFAFIEALWRHLQPQVTLLPWHVEPEQARETCDVLVLAAANQLGPHNDLGGFATHLERIGLPVVALGLGAQAPTLESPVRLPPGTERWVRVLAALAPTSAPNIGLRGEFSRRVLERLGLADRAAIIGCPSNFLNDRPDYYAVLQRRVEKRRIDRLCVAAGSRHFPDMAPIERRLAQFVAATSGSYVVQADLDLLRFARGEPCELEAARRFLAPNLSPAAFAVWRQRHATSFTDATSWADALRGFDFAVGARLHGVIMAFQAGIPGGVLAFDSRTWELCQTMTIPARASQDIPPDFALNSLYALFPLDVAAYAATRERLRGVYVDLLHGAGLTPDSRLTTPQALP